MCSAFSGLATVFPWPSDRLAMTSKDHGVFKGRPEEDRLESKRRGDGSGWCYHLPSDDGQNLWRLPEEQHLGFSSQKLKGSWDARVEGWCGIFFKSRPSQFKIPLCCFHQSIFDDLTTSSGSRLP